MDFLKSNLEHNKASWQWDLLLWSFFVLENFKGRRKFSSTFWTWNQWGFQIQVRIRSTYVTMGINGKKVQFWVKKAILLSTLCFEILLYIFSSNEATPEQEHAYTYSFPGTILPFFKPAEYYIKLVLEKSYWKKLLVGCSDLFFPYFQTLAIKEAQHKLSIYIWLRNTSVHYNTT